MGCTPTEFTHPWRQALLHVRAGPAVRHQLEGLVALNLQAYAGATAAGVGSAAAGVAGVIGAAAVRAADAAVARWSRPDCTCVLQTAVWVG